MAGPFFPPHPQGPADLTDIAGINQTFEGRMKPDGALRDGATAARWSPWIVAKEINAIIDVGKLRSFSNRPPRNNHQTRHCTEPIYRPD